MESQQLFNSLEVVVKEREREATLILMTENQGEAKQRLRCAAYRCWDQPRVLVTTCASSELLLVAINSIQTGASLYQYYARHW